MEAVGVAALELGRGERVGVAQGEAEVEGEEVAEGEMEGEREGEGERFVERVTDTDLEIVREGVFDALTVLVLLLPPALNKRPLALPDRLALGERLEEGVGVEEWEAAGEEGTGVEVTVMDTEAVEEGQVETDRLPLGERETLGVRHALAEREGEREVEEEGEAERVKTRLVARGVRVGVAQGVGDPLGELEVEGEEEGEEVGEGETVAPLKGEGVGATEWEGLAVPLEDLEGELEEDAHMEGVELGETRRGEPVGVWEEVGDTLGQGEGVVGVEGEPRFGFDTVVLAVRDVLGEEEREGDTEPLPD